MIKGFISLLKFSFSSQSCWNRSWNQPQETSRDQSHALRVVGPGLDLIPWVSFFSVPLENKLEIYKSQEYEGHHFETKFGMTEAQNAFPILDEDQS